MTQEFSILSVLLLLVPPAAAAEPAIEYRCPAQIATSQKLAQAVADWREAAAGPGEQVLQTVAFSDGAPEDQAWLVPDNADRLNGRAWTAKWEFAASERIWLTCQYRQTTVMVSRQLPAGLKRCFVRRDGGKAIEVQRVWCEK